MKHCYRARDKAADSTAFIYAKSLSEAKASYGSRHGDPEVCEWRDEGRVLSVAESHLRHAVMMTGWLILFVPCWLITEGVGKALRWIATSHSPSGY